MAEGNASSQVTIYYAADYNNLLNGHGHHSPIQVNDRNFHSMAPGLSIVRDPSTGQEELVAYVTNGTADNGANGQIVAFTMTDPAHAATNAINHGPIPGVVGYDALQFTHPNGKSNLLTSQANRLNIVEMANLWTVKGPTSTIATPTRSWEKPSYTSKQLHSLSRATR